MLNRFIKTGRDLGKQTVNQSAAWVMVVRDTMSGFVTTAHHALMILGVSAIAALALMFVKPEVADHLKAMSPFNSSSEEINLADAQGTLMDVPSTSFSGASSMQKVVSNPAVSNLEVNKAPISDEQEAVAKWISKRYRVAGDATHMLVAAAYKTADELALDPLLILAVAAIESGFNPFAESAMGAQGLMQVMSKVHQDKFRQHGGVKAALNPVTNLKVGALILKEYVRRGGSVEAGLKMYVGAAAFQTDSGYGSRVLAEYRRLQEVAGRGVAAKAIPQSPTTESAVEPKTIALEDDKSAALSPRVTQTTVAAL